VLSQTNMFWLFFIQFPICRVTFWALVELLQGRGFECAWPIGIYVHFWVRREHGSTFFMRLALWHWNCYKCMPIRTHWEAKLNPWVGTCLGP
jgi:hypothetical protein